MCQWFFLKRITLSVYVQPKSCTESEDFSQNEGKFFSSLLYIYLIKAGSTTALQPEASNCQDRFQKIETNYRKSDLICSSVELKYH